MRKRVIVTVVLLGTFIGGFMSGRAFDAFLARRSAAWQAERNAVIAFYEATPGYSEHAAVLRPLIDAHQDQAIASIKRPPRTPREKDSYLTVVVMFAAAESDLTEVPPPAVAVLERALKRRGLNPYWQDPDPRYREEPTATTTPPPGS